jgi:hypothetical protein
VELRRAAHAQAVRDALARVLWAIFGLLILLIAIAIGGVGIWVFLLLFLLAGFILLIRAGQTTKKYVILGLLLSGAALLLAGAHWPQIATLEVLGGLVLAGLGILSLLTPSRSPRVPRVTFDLYPANPPNPFLTISLLKTTFTPSEYRTFPATYKSQSELPAHVWYRLPRYTLARCPFCGVAYTEALDTHSLTYWHIDGNESGAVFATGVDNRFFDCPHLFAVQTHLNLNGAVPIEREYLRSTMSERPYVMTEWLSDSIPAVAVMHSLPICRLEEDRFMPRYLLYTLVYYAQDASTLWARIRQREEADAGPEDYGHVLRYMSPGPRARDWAHWVAQGKLAWLDPTDPAVPLRTGSPGEFPYGRIAGIEWLEFKRGQPSWNGLAKPYQLFWQGPEGSLYWP